MFLLRMSVQMFEVVTQFEIPFPVITTHRYLLLCNKFPSHIHKHQKAVDVGMPYGAVTNNKPVI
jgi:hypothetical protein